MWARHGDYFVQLTKWVRQELLGGEAVGDRMFTVLFDEGSQLTSDEAVAYVLSHDR